MCVVSRFMSKAQNTSRFSSLRRSFLFISLSAVVLFALSGCGGAGGSDDPRAGGTEGQNPASREYTVQVSETEGGAAPATQVSLELREQGTMEYFAVAEGITDPEQGNTVTLRAPVKPKDEVRFRLRSATGADATLDLGQAESATTVEIKVPFSTRTNEFEVEEAEFEVGFEQSFDSNQDDTSSFDTGSSSSPDSFDGGEDEFRPDEPTRPSRPEGSSSSETNEPEFDSGDSTPSRPTTNDGSQTSPSGDSTSAPESESNEPSRPQRPGTGGSSAGGESGSGGENFVTGTGQSNTPSAPSRPSRR